MPPAALTCSTASFMPLVAGTPQDLIGPERSIWVPITISVSVIPWVLNCAEAGVVARPHSATMTPIGR
jgi:hypothetical protein